MFKCLFIPVEPVETTIIGPYPENVFFDRVFTQNGHQVIAQTLRIVRIHPVDLEIVAVINIQTIVRADPKESYSILINIIDGVLRNDIQDKDKKEQAKAIGLAIAANIGSGSSIIISAPPTTEMV